LCYLRSDDHLPVGQTGEIVWHHTGDLGRSDETGCLKAAAGAIHRPKVKEAHGTASVQERLEAHEEEQR